VNRRRNERIGTGQSVDNSIITESSATPERVLELRKHAQQLAQDYRQLTGKPLGVKGEVAEYEAARLLGVTLQPARQAGYDATEVRDGAVRRLQIKGRCLLEGAKASQPLGAIRFNHDWDAVLMVLLDQNFDAIAIYEAERSAVVAALTAPGSRARNERGALDVRKFKSLGKLRWSRFGTGTNSDDVNMAECS